MDPRSVVKDDELEEVTGGAEKPCIGHCPPIAGGGGEDPHTEVPGGQIEEERPLSDFADG